MQFPKIEQFRLDGKSYMNETNKGWFVQEKIDGSQLSFRSVPQTMEFLNKRKTITETNRRFFETAINQLSALKSDLNQFYIYHGEAVTKLKHNKMKYERVPKYNWICFDIYDQQAGQYLELQDMITECDRIGVEYTAVIYQNSDCNINPKHKCKEIIEDKTVHSCLGGNIEGVVFKHPRFLNPKKHSFTGSESTVASKYKMVTEEFKEFQKPKRKKPKSIEDIGIQYNVHARFDKAIQHLREQGITVELTNYNEIAKELDKDLEEECLQDILAELKSLFLSDIKKVARKGLAEYLETLKD